LRNVALANIEVGSDGQVTLVRQTPADILDMLVDSEDFLDNEDDRKCFAFFGHGAIAGYFAIAGRDRHLAGNETIVWSGDGTCGDGTDDTREAFRKMSYEKSAHEIYSL